MKSKVYCVTDWGESMKTVLQNSLFLLLTLCLLTLTARKKDADARKTEPLSKSGMV